MISAPSHPMLRLQECSRLAETGISGPEDMMTLKRALSDLRLHPLFRRKILIEMIGWYRKRLESDEPDTGDDVDYLMDLELERLEREDRAGVCETLIQQGYMREAFEIVKAYGYEELKSSRLMEALQQNDSAAASGKRSSAFTDSFPPVFRGPV